MEEEIRQIQMMLREISFFDENIERIIPDGIYGEQTASSVRSFQRNNNLYETGEVDNDTWDKIIEEYDRIQRENKRHVLVQVIDEAAVPIRVGDAGASLYVIQAMLLALSEIFENIDTVYVTGVFDADTQAAVEIIQIISGITPNATLDRETINALAELYMTYVTRNHVKNSDTIQTNIQK
ncbi:MAG: peptidoglycan-binding protein [Clostridia bacterium]|nr:peptidoglycan-binding protein [Clostridia bacterium]